MKKCFLVGVMLLTACAPAQDSAKPTITDATNWVDLSKRDKRPAIVTTPWQEVFITVTEFDNISRFFTEIGGFETVKKSKSDWVLRAAGSDSGYIHLVKIREGSKPARPASSRSWDKGCYFSVMMRAKNLPSIVKDAAALGWTPLTELAYLEFGPSQLNVIVLTHESGVRVQLYERLTTPLPEGFTPFERISRPFNIMQMVEDRDVGYDFFQQKLGFDTFYYGKPFVSEKEEVMTIGIPSELTTTTPYKTGIMTPKAGLEWGRMEMIDVENMDDGVNFSDQCNRDHTGIIAVRFVVDDLGSVRKDLRARKVDIKKDTPKSLFVKTPDGANIEFYQQ